MGLEPIECLNGRQDTVHCVQPQLVKVQDITYLRATLIRLPRLRIYLDQQWSRYQLKNLCGWGIAKQALACVLDFIPRKVVLNRGGTSSGAQSQQSPQLRLNAKSPLRTNCEPFPPLKAQKWSAAQIQTYDDRSLWHWWAWRDARWKRQRQWLRRNQSHLDHWKRKNWWRARILEKAELGLNPNCISCCNTNCSTYRRFKLSAIRSDRNRKNWGLVVANEDIWLRLGKVPHYKSVRYQNGRVVWVLQRDRLDKLVDRRRISGRLQVLQTRLEHNALFQSPAL